MKHLEKSIRPMCGNWNANIYVAILVELHPSKRGGRSTKRMHIFSTKGKYQKTFEKPEPVAVTLLPSLKNPNRIAFERMEHQAWLINHRQLVTFGNTSYHFIITKRMYVSGGIVGWDEGKVAPPAPKRVAKKGKKREAPTDQLTLF